MATSKRPSDRSAKGRPQSRSLRDQVRSLAPEVTAAAAARAAPPPPPKPRRPASPDELSFKDLAGNGGVRPIADPSGVVVHEPPPILPLRSAPAQHRLWVERRDDSVRARAEDVPPRWLDDLGSGRIVPRRQLDLHRKAAADARHELDEEIPRARREGLTCILVVCGRGLHSGLDGGVLRDVALERLSEELADHILAFCTAPRRWGGEGALLVMLRAQPTGG